MEKSTELYGVKNWGADYFSVSRKGEVMVHPHGNGVGVSLRKIIDGLDDRGLDMPVLLRLSDILDSRIQKLHESFNKAATRMRSLSISACMPAKWGSSAFSWWKILPSWP